MAPKTFLLSMTQLELNYERLEGERAMQIYFIRHGRTQYNLEHRFRQITDSRWLLAESIAKAAGDY